MGPEKGTATAATVRGCDRLSGVDVLNDTGDVIYPNVAISRVLTIKNRAKRCHPCGMLCELDDMFGPPEHPVYCGPCFRSGSSWQALPSVAMD